MTHLFHNILQQNFAESHYKFKLPWAPLYKREANIFLDAPFQILPKAKLPLILIVRNSHYFPITITQIKLDIRSKDSDYKDLKTLDVNIICEKEFIFENLDYDLPKDAAKYHINYLISYTNSKGQKRQNYNWNLPTLKKTPLEITRLSEELPYPKNWSAGDTHYHSWHTVSPVEYGAPLDITQVMAKAVGLDWLCITDHSYDFNYDRYNYIKETDPNKRWNDFLIELKQVNQNSLEKDDPQQPVLIVGEEVSCSNIANQNVHALVLNHKNYIPGQGDGGRRWLNNKPDLKVIEVAQEAKSDNKDSLVIAAHPLVKIGPLESFIFHRGRWWVDDFSNQIKAIQFWNGSRFDNGFSKGRDFWIKQLLKDNFLIPVGGNDAHGDFNISTGVKTPLFSLKSSKSHVFGRVRTVIPTKSKKPNEIINCLKTKLIFVTDGPAITLEIIDDKLKIWAKSITEYGNLERIIVYWGSEGSVKENSKLLAVSDSSFEDLLKIDSKAKYYRAECITKQGYFALTSALKINL